MTSRSKFTFLIAPVSAKRMTQGQVKLMRIPDTKLRKDQVAVKTRLRKYLQFKDGLLMLAKKDGFVMPHSGIEIIFWIATKDEARWGEFHKMKPDVDNLLKSVFDALCPEDGFIAEVKASKYWTKPGHERVDIHLNRDKDGTWLTE